MSLSSALSGLDDASAAYAYANDAPARGAGGGPKAKGGGRSKGGGGGEGDHRTVLVSKKMSYLLRHGAEKERVKIDEGGWVNVQDLLDWRTLKSMKVSFAEVQSVVENNNKKRFELERVPAPATAEVPGSSSEQQILDVESSDTPVPASTSGPDPTSASMAQLNLSSPTASDPSIFRIRAAQGHSLSTISSEALLQPLGPNDASTPRYVMHGTTPAAWAKIQASGGLSRMGRGHVHTAVGTGDAAGDRAVWRLIEGGSSLVYDDDDAGAGDVGGAGEDESSSREKGPDGAVPVAMAGPAAGRRAGRTVLLWISVAKSAAEGGLRWWRSSNGVVLSEGDARGMIPLKYVEVVELRRKVTKGKKKDEWERVVIWRDGREVDEP